MNDNEKRHPIDAAGPWIALSAAVGLTATGEYQLAQLAGWGSLVAGLLPTAVDVYVVTAIRAHKDVAGAVLMMIATNALYHLAAVNLFGTDGRPGHLAWWLIVAVTAIAPLVMWRIHGILQSQKHLSAPPADTQPDNLRAGVQATVSGAADNGHQAPAVHPDSMRTVGADTPRTAALEAPTDTPDNTRTTASTSTDNPDNPNADNTPDNVVVPMSTPRTTRRTSRPVRRTASGGQGPDTLSGHVRQCIADGITDPDKILASARDKFGPDTKQETVRRLVRRETADTEADTESDDTEDSPALTGTDN